jgi:hypothetical protein
MTIPETPATRTKNRKMKRAPSTDLLSASRVLSPPLEPQSVVTHCAVAHGAPGYRVIACRTADLLKSYRKGYSLENVLSERRFGSFSLLRFPRASSCWLDASWLGASDRDEERAGGKPLPVNSPDRGECSSDSGCSSGEVHSDSPASTEGKSDGTPSTEGFQETCGACGLPIYTEVVYTRWGPVHPFCRFRVEKP